MATCDNKVGYKTYKENDFSSARLGQELWSSVHGRVEVMGICCGEISFSRLLNANQEWILPLNGKNAFGLQILYWSKPEIEFIPDPKVCIPDLEKVEKEIIKYINVFKTCRGDGFCVSAFATETEARQYASSYIYSHEFVKIAHKITIQCDVLQAKKNN